MSTSLDAARGLAAKDRHERDECGNQCKFCHEEGEIMTSQPTPVPTCHCETEAQGARIIFCPLHAAAPDLLAACQATLAHLVVCDDHESESAELGATALEHLKQALARATGQKG